MGEIKRKRPLIAVVSQVPMTREEAEAANREAEAMLSEEAPDGFGTAIDNIVKRNELDEEATRDPGTRE